MEETTMSAAFKDATDKLHDRVVSLGDASLDRIRANAPVVRKVIDRGYGHAAEAVRSLAGNRTAQGWLAAGAVGILVGIFLSRREGSR